VGSFLIQFDPLAMIHLKKASTVTMNKRTNRLDYVGFVSSSFSGQVPIQSQRHGDAKSTVSDIVESSFVSTAQDIIRTNL
jgi:hypothetical protein